MANNIRDAINHGPMGRFQVVAVIICVCLNMLDGFDVLVMAFTAPSISADWGLTGSNLGVLFSTGLAGMAIGSLFLAPFADYYGRRTIILISLVLISAGMFLSATAHGVTELGIYRFITGLGIGSILASLNVITAEYSSDKWRSTCISLMTTGYGLGATLGGMVTAVLLAHYSWRSAFVFGAIVSTAMIPAVLWRLPESLDFLIARRPNNALQKLNHLLRRMSRDEIPELPAPVVQDKQVATGFRSLFSGNLLHATLFIWGGFFFMMAGFYFVMSWTPKLLVEAGMSTTQGISGGVLLNLGGIIGGVIFSLLSSRFRLRPLTYVYLFCISVFVIAFGFAIANLTTALITAVVIGSFMTGAMAGLYALTPSLYPATVRTTGMGWAIGMGRFGAVLSPLGAGYLRDVGWSATSLYVLFAFSFLIAALSISMIKLHRLSEEDAAEVIT